MLQTQNSMRIIFLAHQIIARHADHRSRNIFDMREGGWIPLDKRLVQYLPYNRAYTELEAMFSLTKDIDEGVEKSVREYSRIWSWSRQKVCDFMDKLRATNKPEESQKKADRKPPFRIIINNLQTEESQEKADRKPVKGRKKAGTVDPNPNPYKNLSSSDDEVQGIYITKKRKKLSGKRLETFIQFWDAFDYKEGKAEAADAWLEIPILTDKIVTEIIESAKKEAKRRPQIELEGKTPKMAQGWLSGKRWEDEKKLRQIEHPIIEIDPHAEARRNLLNTYGV